MSRDVAEAASLTRMCWLRVSPVGTASHTREVAIAPWARVSPTKLWTASERSS